MLGVAHSLGRGFGDSMLTRLASSVQWDATPAQTHRSAAAVFDHLLDESNGVLVRLLNEVGDDARLSSLCERLGFMDKLVVWEDRERDLRLRVHVFRPGYTDAPHDHRFDFATRIVDGSYRHSLYESDALISEPKAALEPVMVRTESAGSGYLLRRDAVHAVHAQERAVSLMLRGPLLKSSATILSPTHDEPMVLRSAQTETASQRRAKQMSAADLAAVTGEVLGVLGVDLSGAAS